MRSLDTDDAQPLGPAKPRDTPKPAPRETEVRPGIIRDKDGKLRTSIPENESANIVPPFPYYGSPTTWGRAIEAIRGGK